MLFTIGHSNHPIEAFIELLRRHGVSALGDVRSHPYSRFVPQYSREPLKAALFQADVSYVFLGKELGARSEDPACYRQGKVQYDCLARQPRFAAGIRRVMKGMQRDSIALMCAEKDPLECHRSLLVARKLFEAGVEIAHIHADGSVESHRALETRLLAVCRLPEGDMFNPREEFVSEAYAIQGDRVAYQDTSMEQLERASAS
ncbi:MAG: DUF488 family protein [Gammaproteobacteria bacterium]